VSRQRLGSRGAARRLSQSPRVSFRRKNQRTPAGGPRRGERGARGPRLSVCRARSSKRSASSYLHEGRVQRAASKELRPTRCAQRTWRAPTGAPGRSGCAASSQTRRRTPPSPPFPVLTGHVSSFSPYKLDTSRPSPRTNWTRANASHHPGGAARARPPAAPPGAAQAGGARPADLQEEPPAELAELREHRGRRARVTLAQNLQGPRGLFAARGLGADPPLPGLGWGWWEGEQVTTPSPAMRSSSCTKISTAASYLVRAPSAWGPPRAAAAQELLPGGPFCTPARCAQVLKQRYASLRAGISREGALEAEGQAARGASGFLVSGSALSCCWSCTFAESRRARRRGSAKQRLATASILTAVLSPVDVHLNLRGTPM